MLIGVDGFELSVPQRVGVGRLAVELLRSLAEVDKKNEYKIYLPAPPKVTLPQRKKWGYKILPFRRLWSQVSLPLYLFFEKRKPDIFLAPSHYAPRFCPCPCLIFILDLSFLYFPTMFKRGDLYKLVNWTKYSVLKAKKVIAISRSTKNDIIKYYAIEAEKVKVVYPGVKNLKTQMSKVKKKYGIGGEYILYVGTLQPRKNLVRLIEAFKRVKESRTQRVNGLKLVIVGKKGWMWEEIFAKVKELNLEDEVIFTGYVPEEDLPELYRGAKCFVLLSLYEGFGFPVLEAMRYGCPVVCSKVSSLPEIAGEAAILVDPYKVKDIARGIIKVLASDRVKRQKMIERGLRQAKKFTWEKTAKEVLKVFEEVAKIN